MLKRSELLPPIIKKVGEIFEVLVPSNPTTGYGCTLSNMPQCLYMISSIYEPSKPIVAGSGGTQIFKFLAVMEGKGELEFRDVKCSDPPEILPPNLMHSRFAIINK